MGTKNDPGNFDCYANAKPDEPMFILLARDFSGPFVVRTWAIVRVVAMLLGVKPWSHWAKVREAWNCAASMAAYVPAVAAFEQSKINLAYLDATRLSEEVPGVPDDERWYLWRNRTVEAHFASEADGREYCTRNNITIDTVEYFEP